MAHNRDAPAYQEYAANILAQISFRGATLQDRGLLYTLRLECWVNVTLPADPTSLARLLGLPIDEIAKSLPVIALFFRVADGQITCPELDGYRTHLENRRINQSKGGKRGAAITNKKRKHAGKPVNTSDSSIHDYPDDYPAKHPDGVLVQPNAVQPSQMLLAREEKYLIQSEVRGGEAGPPTKQHRRFVALRGGNHV